MLRCTFFGCRTASTPKTSTEPPSGTTSVETTRTSVLFPLPFGPRTPTTSPRPTASEIESRTHNTSPRRFLKLFSTLRNSKAFKSDLLKCPPPPRGGPALQPAPRFQPLPDQAPGLLPLGGHRQLEEPPRHPGAPGGLVFGPRVPLALGHAFGEILLAKNAILHPIQRIPVHLSVSLLPSSLVARVALG